MSFIISVKKEMQIKYQQNVTMNKLEFVNVCNGLNERKNRKIGEMHTGVKLSTKIA